MKSLKHYFLQTWICGLFSIIALPLYAQPKNELFLTLLPIPRNIQILEEKSEVFPRDIVGFHLGKKTKIPFGQTYFPNKEYPAAGKNIISLSIDKSIKHNEGYKLSSQNGIILIKARTQAGLLYGLQTLIQLSQNSEELRLPIPAFVIEDEPETEYRSIQIDMKHHLDKMDYMYKILDRMAYYKLNAAIVEFEDKIKYEKYPTIGAANAVSIEEWRKWSEYAYQLNIEISPLIQGIGHADFILKHDEFKKLREDANSDWICCPSNEEYYALQFSLYDEAIRATPHGKYLHIGGDEVGDLGICPVCKKKNISSLEHQLQWLKKVSNYVVSKGRIPIFWDDMLFKNVGLYSLINGEIDSKKMDSIWQANLPKLNEHLHHFPKNVIYMRWQYFNADQKGNKLALKWYKDNNLPVMGATAAQTTFAMMPQWNGNINSIYSFHKAHREIPLTGIFCTAWDDCSPLFDTFWRGFIAHAQYCWNFSENITNDNLSYRYRIREFGNHVASLPEFRSNLENTFPLWINGLTDIGSRQGMWATKCKFQIMTLPTEEKGAWTQKYIQRIESAKKNIIENQRISQLLTEYRKLAIRNDYSLQVFERINDLTGYTAELLLALSTYDIERDVASLNNLRLCVDKFKTVRSNMEHVYSQIRYLNQPEGYILPMNHHSHLAIVTANSDWMFLFEVEMVKQLEEFLKNNYNNGTNINVLK